MMRLLVAGTSTRALAASAARAGLAVTALDGFADRDQHPSVVARAVCDERGRPAGALDLARAAISEAADAVVYGSPFENHPGAVAMLARGRALWGNAPEALRRARDPLEVTARLKAAGVAVARSFRSDEPPDGARRCLVKPRRSGGGVGVRWWDGATSPRGDEYLQEHVAGLPGSVTFVASRTGCAVIGVSWQLTGDAAFGAAGHRYCGSIGVTERSAGPFSASLVARCTALAHAAAGQFDLIGLNGVDFIACGDDPYAIEINPRWSSSMELAELSAPVPLMALHARACGANLELPSPGTPGTSTPTPEGTPAEAWPQQVAGKAILFARQTTMVPDMGAWLDGFSLGDVPWPGAVIPMGAPICTVYARASSAAACYGSLVERASALYGVLEETRG